ncbi:MAG: nitroreductase [Flavobacteriales bacterium]|nr:nitroreductase [Flavobacteriales bacterium]
MKYNLTEIISLIKDRRTIYPEQYKSRKVHKEQVELMLDAANWAPTHGMTEPWRFKVFSGNKLRELMQIMADIYRDTTPPEQFMDSKYHRFAERAEKTSYVIAVCMKRQESERIPEIEEVMAVACAVQNLMLTATAYGIGTFWSTGGGVYSKRLHDYLNLGHKDKCLGLIYIGYPQGEWPTGKRGIIYNKVEWYE